MWWAVFMLLVCSGVAEGAEPQVSAGRDHTVGLKTDGTVVAVGQNYHGQNDVSGWDIEQYLGGDLDRDGVVDFMDFVFFAEYWRDDNCDISNDYCDGTDLDFSGTVDEADLEILIDNWLAGGKN